MNLTGTSEFEGATVAAHRVAQRLVDKSTDSLLSILISSRSDWVILIACLFKAKLGRQSSDN